MRTPNKPTTPLGFVTTSPTRLATSPTRLATGLTGLALAGLLSGCWGNRSEDPPVHIIWNMDFQDKWDPQEKVSFFADGRAMRPPVEGTVARGQLKDDDLLWRGRGFDGRFADQLPESIKLDAELLERGRERYDIYCAPCHDETGQGKGIVTQRGGGFKVAPANLHQERLLPMPLGYFYDVITNGKMPNMLPYAAQIPVEDRWAIAVWLRTLQIYGKDKHWGAAPVASAPSPAEDAGAPTGPAGHEGGHQ
jgi:mono/diheme cytochrome c family protein